MDDPIRVENEIAFPFIAVPLISFDTMDEPVIVEYVNDITFTVEPYSVELTRAIFAVRFSLNTVEPVNVDTDIVDAFKVDVFMVEPLRVEYCPTLRHIVDANNVDVVTVDPVTVEYTIAFDKRVDVISVEFTVVPFVTIEEPIAVE